jgi:pyruvate kinase
VRATVAAALRACAALAGQPGPAVDAGAFDRGPARLEANTTALLGPGAPDRSLRIMVTLPTEAAEPGSELIAGLIDAGMDCARVNTAHDDPETRRAMIAGRGPVGTGGRGSTGSRRR